MSIFDTVNYVIYTIYQGKFLYQAENPKGA